MQLINPPHTPEVSQDFPLGQLESVSHSSKIDIKIDKIYLIQTLNLIIILPTTSISKVNVPGII